jgi:hypothetical protein
VEECVLHEVPLGLAVIYAVLANVKTEWAGARRRGFI